MIRVNWQPCSGPEPFNCRLCRLRAPSTLRSLNILGIERELAEHAEILRGCNFVTAPSRFVADQVAKGIKREVTVIPNGVSTQPEQLCGDVTELYAGIEGPYVLFASRATVEKGYYLSLDAFSSSTLAGYTLAVAGNPPERHGKGNGKETGLNVRIIGKQSPSQMLPLVAGASCVIVPSSWPENCPMIILEALRAGVPVVATRIGGIPELVEDGVTGILIKPSDPAGLANAIVKACTDASLRESARRKGPLAVRELFSLDIMAASLEELYAA